MTVIIPMAIVLVIMGGLGLYFARTEGKKQQSAYKVMKPVEIPRPAAVQDPQAAQAQQSSRTGPQSPAVDGVRLHPTQHAH